MDLDHLTAEFRHRFDGAEPTHLTRAPGRVNLIGEHTDYNGLPVFPMALQRGITLLFRPRDDAVVRFANTIPEFTPRNFEMGEAIEPDEAGSWGNYVKAPCQEMSVQLGASDVSGPLRGFDALVTSDLPVASGLSSSSALVIATGLTLAAVNEISVPVLEMAEMMAGAERYTGTRGGGMDQAASLGCRDGCAARIEFSPLRMFPTPVPPEWRFVVAFTLVRAEKSGSAQAAYNLRTKECKEALEWMILALGSPDAPRDFPTHPAPGAAETYPELVQRFSAKELVEIAEARLEGDLLKRFRHVVTEAERVYAAEAAMADGDLGTFGSLMNASHLSLQEDYEVSSPELDELVELAREGGASGARLTGAGLGGCIVALCDAERSTGVVARLKEGFYSRRDVPGSLDDHLFVATPSAGASVRAL